MLEAAVDGRLVHGGVLVVAVPGVLASENIRERAGRVERGAQEPVLEGVGVAFDGRVGDVAIDRIFTQQPEGTDGGSNDEVHPAGVVCRGSLWAGAGNAGLTWMLGAVERIGKAALVEDSGLAERTDLPLCGVDGSPEKRAKTTVPVRRVTRDAERATVGIVLDFEVSGDGSFHGMSEVVHLEAVAVVPAAHVELTKGGPVVRPEGLVEEIATELLVGDDDARTVLYPLKGEGLKDETLPIKVLARERIRGSGIRRQQVITRVAQRRSAR